jgi:plastocyanin
VDQAKRWLVVGAVVLALVGCKADQATHETEVIDKAVGPAKLPVVQVPIGAGQVVGTVSLDGKMPTKVLIDTTMDPACGIGSSAPVYTEQYVGSNGKLANVFVYVKSGPPAAMQTGVVAAPVVLDQKGCQYVPHVIGVEMGGTVEFRNSDVTMHNIHTMPEVNAGVDVSQGPRGAAVTRQFKKAEMMIPVRCNNHPWMNAFINVAPTPFFAVTDAAGHFALTGLPAGEYVIGAVHEKLGEQELKVVVPATGPAKAEFKFAMK